MNDQTLQVTKVPFNYCVKWITSSWELLKKRYFLLFFTIISYVLIAYVAAMTSHISNILSLIVVVFVSFIFQSAVFVVIDKVYRDQEVVYSDLFYFLRNRDKLKKLLPYAYAQLMINAPLIVTKTLFEHLNFNESVESITITALGFVTGLLGLALFMSLPQMIFNDLHIIETVKNNIIAIKKNFMTMIGFAAVSAVVLIISLVMLILPFVFVGLPLLSISLYFVYITIFENKKIGVEQVEPNQLS